MKSVGESIIRPDSLEKVLGKAIYPDDIEFDDMLYAGVKRSSIAYGKILSINIDEVRRMNDIVEVIDYSMLPSANSHGVI